MMPVTSTPSAVSHGWRRGQIAVRGASSGVWADSGEAASFIGSARSFMPAHLQGAMVKQR